MEGTNQVGTGVSEQDTATAQEKHVVTAQRIRDAPTKGEDARSKAESSRALKEILAPVRSQLAAASLLQAIASICAVAPLALIGIIGQQMIDSAQGTGQGPNAWALGGIVAALVIRALAEVAALGISHSADARLQHHLRWRIVDAVSTVPLSWFKSTATGTVRKSVSDDVQDLHFLVAHARIEQIAGIVTPLAGLVWAAILDWRLAIISIFPLLFYVVRSAIAMRDSQETMENIDLSLNRMSAAISEFIHGIAVVKIFGSEHTAHKRFVDAADEYHETYGGWARNLVKGSAISSVVMSAPVITLLIAAFGTWFVAAGWTEPATVITVALIAIVIPTTLVSLGFSVQYQRQAIAATERISKVLSTKALPEVQHDADIADSSIELDNVTYRYGDGATALRHISLSLPAGSTTAFVGPSGAGKSTLATLIARFDDVSEGAICLGGVDLRDIPLSQLYDNVSFVLQDTGLVGMSIADNIKLGTPGASAEEVREAARRAQIADDIEQLPAGYDTMVTSDSQLSGGQRQRIAIARAILRNAPVVILDEATSFADPDSEVRIQQALSELTKDSTVIVIAHRLHTIVDADRIVVLSDGSVEESGTHEELLARSGMYANLWSRLSGAQREDRL